MIRCLAYAFTAIFKSRARLVAENLCLRQQLIVLKRRQARPQLRDADRRFWILACRLFSGWSRSLIVVKPDTVVSWHRRGWKAYWRWRSRRPSRTGCRKIEAELRELIRRMAQEKSLWGARSLPLGYNAESRRNWHVLASGFVRVLSPDTCAVHTVQTVWFQTLYVFFILHHGTRELVHARVTAHPNSAWLAQQMVEACGISREPPRYLIHDRDGCFGASFNRRVASLGIRQIRTPIKAPKANAFAERWVRTIRNECLDHRLIFGHHHLQRTVDEYVAYYNRWRPHRSLGQRAPCPHVREVSRKPARHLTSKPVLGGLHHVYQWAA